jgi:hypothetical protein
MAEDQSIIELDALTAPSADDLIPIVDDPGGTPVIKKITVAVLFGGGGDYPTQGRLTLESGVPVSANDKLAKTTLYYTPYKGNRFATYDGVSAWTALTFAELSLDISAYTASKNYDIFGYDSGGGVLALEGLVWTNNTTRATALVLQDGVLVKSGATTRRYIGTIHITATTGQCEDSVKSRLVWNYYNQKPRFLHAVDNTGHTYTTGSYRAWNNETTLGVTRYEWVQGVVEGWIENRLQSNMYTAGGATASGFDGIAIDATNVGTVYVQFSDQQVTAGQLNQLGLFMEYLYLSIGYHYAQITEMGVNPSCQHYYVDMRGTIEG